MEISTLNKYTVSKLSQMGPICLKDPVEMNEHQAGYHKWQNTDFTVQPACTRQLCI